MSRNSEKTDRIQFKQKLTIIIQKNGYILLGILLVIVFTIVGLLIFNSLQMKNLEKSVQKIELIQEAYQNLSTIADETKKKVAQDKIKQDLDSLIDEGRKDYSLQRALFMRANLYFKNKDWDSSIKDFELLASEFPKSYLSPISLINAGTAFEESGKIDEAIEVYKKVVTDYSNSSPEISNIYFSIGRLYEAESDFDSALDTYNTLLDKFPNSNWTNLARSRIINLESR